MRLRLAASTVHCGLTPAHRDYIKIGRRRLITRQHLEQFLQIAPKPQPPQAAQESARGRPKHAVSSGGKDMPLA